MRARSALLYLTKLAALRTGKSSNVLLRLTVALLEAWRPGQPPRPNPKVVSEEHYNALLESLDQVSGKWSRLAALYLRSTLPIGVRLSEWPSVEWADDSQKEVRVFTSKRKIDVAPVAPTGAASADRNEDDGYRYIPVDESARASIQQQISVVQSVLQHCTTPGEIELAWARYGAEIRQALNRACERISTGREKPVNVSPTTARAMFRANALQFHSREYVNVLMGHRSLASGRSYGKASQAFKTVKAAAQKLRVTQAENAQRDGRSRERAESNLRQ